MHWMELIGREGFGVHGCCGCCQTAEWKLADATQGYEKANELLVFQIDNFKRLAELYRELKKEVRASKVPG